MAVTKEFVRSILRVRLRYVVLTFLAVLTFLSVITRIRSGHQLQTSVQETSDGHLFHKSSAVHKTRINITNQNSDEGEPPFNRILINSYKRSGSTFLGRAVGWSSDSFFWYEPLMPNYVDNYFYANATRCHYSKSICSTFSREKFYEEMATIFENIAAIYNCNFTRLSNWVDGMNNFILSEQGPSWEVYRQCKAKNKHRMSLDSSCLSQLVPVCKRAKNRVIKLLRVELSLASQLLTTIPDLKMVQLFRDPRGLLNSHISTGWFPVHENNLREQREDMAVSCDRQRKDMAMARELLPRFPTRFRIVQYEDFDTYEKMQRLYRFLGMNFSEKTNDLLDKLCKGHGTAGFHPFDFRNTLSWESVELANKYCADIYEELGFVNFENETDIRNNALQIVYKKLPYAL